MLDPIPPYTSRQDALGQLRRERWHALDAGELRLAAEIDAQIERLSAASSPVSPRRETTAAKRPQTQRKARTS